MSGPDYSKRGYLLPNGCTDLADALVVTVAKAPTVLELAGLIGKSPAALTADLFQLGIFASAQQPLSFETASRVAQKYGYVVRQA